MAQQPSDNMNDHNTSSILSTDSLLSTNTTTSTINPLLRDGARPHPSQKDYSAALSILQSRYGASGGAIPNPKNKPSNKLQHATQTNTNGTGSFQPANMNTGPAANSQLTLVPMPSIPNSTNSQGTSTSVPSTSSAGDPNKKSKKSRISSLFKGKKGEEKK